LEGRPAVISIRQLLLGESLHVRYAQRWQSSRVGQRETTAEHSWFVCFYSMVVADWLMASRSDLRIPNHAKLFRRAVLHDMEEARTGDINRRVKHGSPELLKALTGVGERAVREILEPALGAGVAQGYALEWRDAKDNTMEGRIVKFADFLAALAYICEEIKSSNYTICRYIKDVRAYAESFLGPDYEELWPLARQALVVFEEEIEPHMRKEEADAHRG
jgi:5'-deoxynucleotidase YfbR-like HD superfamily hydrolase